MYLHGSWTRAVDLSCAIVLTTVISAVLSHPHCSHPGFCANGGTCVETMTSASCICPPGFSGVDCSERDVCSGGPCGHHGKCVADSVTGSYSCHCDPPYLGLQCEQRLSQQCSAGNAEESFCMCEVDGSPVKFPIRSPPTAPPRGLGSRDALWGLTGVLAGWVVGCSVMTLLRCCKGSGCWSDVTTRTRRPPIRVRPASSTGSSCPDSTPPSSPRDSHWERPESLSRASMTGPINVYRAGFNDAMAHQTAVRQSASTYTSGQKDW